MAEKETLNGEIVCSMSGKLDLWVKAKLPAGQKEYKFGDKVKVVILGKDEIKG